MFCILISVSNFPCFSRTIILIIARQRTSFAVTGNMEPEISDSGSISLDNVQGIAPKQVSSLFRNDQGKITCKKIQ